MEEINWREKLIEKLLLIYTEQQLTNDWNIFLLPFSKEIKNFVTVVLKKEKTIYFYIWCKFYNLKNKFLQIYYCDMKNNRDYLYYFPSNEEWKQIYEFNKDNITKQLLILEEEKQRKEIENAKIQNIIEKYDL